MGKVGVAVVGLGRIGRVHAEIFRTRVDGAELIAVVDVVEHLAREVGEALGVRWYTDCEDVLRDGDVDAVVICTPTYLHAEMISLAAEHGKHVMCEKPMAVRVGEAREALARVERAGVKLQVGYMRRFDRAYRAAKERIEGGEIGRPLTFIATSRDPAPPPGWVADPRLSGGLFLDLMSHDFDMARWLMGSEVRRVHVVGGALVYDSVRERGDLDTALVTLEFENGAIGAVHANRNAHYGYDIRTEVIGTEGVVAVGTHIDSSLHVAKRGGITFGGFPWFQERFYDAYLQEDRHFVRAILEDTEPLVGGVDGLRAVQIAEACWESFRSGGPREVSLG